MITKHDKPDFLIVGAAKSGTTSLFHYLHDHPDVYVPDIKECRFFSQAPQDSIGLNSSGVVHSNGGIRNDKEYFTLFNNRQNKVCGDISPDYLYYYEESIKNIKKYLDDSVKIIIILRNPSERAYSLFTQLAGNGKENLQFEQALDAETDRIKKNWSWVYNYVHSSLYYDAVKAYKDNFKNVKIYLFEDLVSDENFFDDLCEFIDVTAYEKNSKKYNVSGQPKSKMLHKFLIKRNFFRIIFGPIVKVFFSERQIGAGMDFFRNKNMKKIPINSETKKRLKLIFRDDIKKLSTLINRDLSKWL